MVSRHARSGNSVPTDTNGQPEKTPFPSLADCRKPRPVSWIIPGLIVERMVNVIQGKKATGKSCFYAWLVAVWLGNQKLAGHTNGKRRRGRVFVASEEPYADLVLPRFKAVGVKPTSILWHGKADGSGREPFSLPNEYDRIEWAVKRQNVGLVIVDSFAHFLTHGYSANDEGQVRQALEPAVRMGEEYGTTFAFTQHVRKSEADSEIEQGRGSGGIAEVARSVVQLKRKSERPVAGVIKCVGANAGQDGRRWGYEITVNGKGARFTLGDELDAGDDIDPAALDAASERTKFDRMCEMLKEELAEGEVESKTLLEIAERWGGTQPILWRAASHLGCVHRRKGKGKAHNSYWRLPDAKPAK